MSTLVSLSEAFLGQLNDQIITPGKITCSRHPRYQVKRKPTGKCKACWILWNDANTPVPIEHQAKSYGRLMR